MNLSKNKQVEVLRRKIYVLNSTIKTFEETLSMAYAEKYGLLKQIEVLEQKLKDAKDNDHDTI